MSAHLINISIGPVQPFIAAARRTRDLWFGSRLLSEICMETARSVKDSGGELIFPQEDSLNVSDGVDPNVANVILAELPDGDPAKVVSQAREKALSVLRDYGDQVLGEYGELVNRDLWDDQIEQALEFFAVWVPYGSEDYLAARDKIGRLMGARKNCRDFVQLTDPESRQIEKSSLDGRSESVLKDREKVEELLDRNPTWKLRLRLKSTEALDALGLIKRGGNPSVMSAKDDFPSVEQFAAKPWMDRAEKEAPEEFRRLKKAQGEAGGISLSDVVFPFRIAQVQEETGRDLNAVKMALNCLVKRIGEPDPYLAVLKADGDKMGAAISSIETPKGHRTFSSELASFATKAHGIVGKHGGKCIYAGGDDVLAFLPLNSCLECARELADAFKGSFVKSAVSDTPTLSVGIAVGHFLEPLEDLLKFADEAEAKAKGTDRNGLAVVVRSRGNAPIGFRKRWDSTVADLTVDKRLRLWARLFDEEVISSRFPYELRSMEGFYGNWKDQSSIKEAIPADVFRVLGKKRSVGGDSKEVAKELKAIVETITSVENLKELVSELLVARHLGPVMEVKS